MRLWLSLLEDQVDVVLASSKFSTGEKYNPELSLTSTVKDSETNSTQMIREIDGNWTEMVINGSLLVDNIFSSFKSKIQTTTKLNFYGIIGDPSAQ